MYGFIHNVGCRLSNQRYEDRHYQEVMKWILYRELVSIADNCLNLIFNSILEMLNYGVRI
jgi:hypothetical protein